METVRRRVAIGGSFACDDTLAVPLQHLLENVRAVFLCVAVQFAWDCCRPVHSFCAVQLVGQLGV